MKYKLATLLFLTFTSLMYAQHNSSIDFVGSLDYSFRFFNYSGDDDLWASFAEDRNVKEEVKSNWRYGLNYNKRLKNNLFLKTGLRLGSVVYNEHVTSIVDIDNQEGPVTVELHRDLQFIYNYIFIEIPVMARWEWNANNWSPYIEAGLSPHIYLTNRERQIVDIENEVYWSRNGDGNIHNFQFVASLSFGLNYQLNHNLQIFAQPVGRYHITSLGKGPVKERLWSVGLEVGVRKGL